MYISDKEIQSKADKLKNLVSLKHKSKEELFEQAKELLEKEKSAIDISILFKDRTESKRAKELLFKYLDDFVLETISDKNTLRELIYLEILQQRLQEKLNDYYTNDTKAVPLQLVETIHKNSDAILKLKNTLGLVRSKQRTDSGFDAINKLMARFKQWREDNQASRHLCCPHCGKMIMLKIRTKYWEAQKHPFFRDRVLGNPTLIKLYQAGILTKEHVSTILESATDYVDWLIDKWNLTPNPEEQAAKPRSDESGGNEVESGNREKEAPSSLKQEETENNESERNTEGSPADRERVGEEEIRETDPKSEGNSSKDS